MRTLIAALVLVSIAACAPRRMDDPQPSSSGQDAGASTPPDAASSTSPDAGASTQVDAGTAVGNSGLQLNGSVAFVREKR